MIWGAGRGPTTLKHSKGCAHLCTGQTVARQNEHKGFQLDREASFVLATVPSITKGSRILCDGLPHHVNCTGLPHVDSLQPVLKAELISNTGTWSTNTFPEKRRCLAACWGAAWSHW